MVDDEKDAPESRALELMGSNEKLTDYILYNRFGIVTKKAQATLCMTTQRRVR